MAGLNVSGLEGVHYNFNYECIQKIPYAINTIQRLVASYWLHTELLDSAFQGKHSRWHH